MPAVSLALSIPPAHRDALRIAGRELRLRHRLLLDQGKDGFLSFEAEMAKPAAPVEPPPIGDDAQAFQPYTSGSTGRPKGAIMTHQRHAVVRRLQPALLAVGPSDRGLVALPLFHKNALRGTVKPMLYAGGSFVLMPGYEPRAYLEALGEIQVHLFARRGRGVHHVSAASRSPEDARSHERCAA